MERFKSCSSIFSSDNPRQFSESTEKVGNKEGGILSSQQLRKIWKRE
jgi:hypothetical protein